MPKRNGIDVSRYQGLVDWGKVAGSGVVWAATKATQGTRYADATLARNRAGMASAQIRHRLFYHWLNPAPALVRLSAKARAADARKQAAHFLATVGPLSAGEGVMLDAEQDGITADAVLAWCEAVEAKTGRPVAVYTGVYVAKGSIWQSRSIFNGRRPRVLAAYTTEQRARTIATPYRWDVWQWTGSGRMPGVGPEVDIDQVDNAVIFDAVCGLTVKPALAATAWPAFNPSIGECGLYPIATNKPPLGGQVWGGNTPTGHCIAYVRWVMFAYAGYNGTNGLPNLKPAANWGSWGYGSCISAVKNLQALFGIPQSGIVSWTDSNADGLSTWGAVDFVWAWNH